MKQLSLPRIKDFDSVQRCFDLLLKHLEKINLNIKDSGYYKGEGSPEGLVLGNPGDLYADITTGKIYKKTTNAVKTGWLEIS